jgi:Secretion system C-terminal sorting domain
MKILMKGFKTIFKTLATLTLLSIFGQTYAQDSCTFRLRLFDKAGNGWDDSQLYIKTGNNAEKAYTHNGAGGDSLKLFDIAVKTGDTLVVRYEPQGTAQSEIKFTLFNNAGDQIVALGPTPTTGIVYKGRVKCIACGAPSNFRVHSVRALTTTVQWDPPKFGFQPTYRIEWDSVAFTPGANVAKNSGSTTDTFAILPGLSETTRYFAYIRTTCNPATDTSGWVGPISFKTDTATNVGISAIVGPISRCDLGTDSVRVKIKNYGGAPIALVPFTYSVNGKKAPVSMPTDGLYTGVISKDSTATIAFKAIYDFSLPGEYNIAAWTEVKTDKNKNNDTFRLTVVRPRQISALPYQQDFEGGRDTWQKVDSIGNSTWEWGTPRYRFIQGAASGSKCWTTSADSSYRDADTSYLLSPCFDFSTQTADPRINFALNFYTEARSDGAWLEGSTDGGKSWSKIGSRNSGGINWYNETLASTNFEFWSGTSIAGWHTAQHTLTGMAGKRDVRLRFAFKSDNISNNAYDGIALDNIVLASTQSVDLAMDSIGRVDLSDCGSAKDTILLRLVNLGNTAQSSYTVNYRIDNNLVVSENVSTLNILPNKSLLYKFQTTTNTLLGIGTHTIKAWVTSSSDNIRVNDTAMTTFIISPPVRGNTVFNFDNAIPPQYWTINRAEFGRGIHGNTATNGAAFAKIFKDVATPNSTLLDMTTNKFGIIRADDSLKYDYRFVSEVSPFNGYDLISRDTLRVMAAKECENTWVEIDKISRANHTISSNYRTRSLSLKSFTGQLVKIRFQVTSEINTATGYYIDVDNVNYQSICPASFGTTANIKRANVGLANGYIAVKISRGQAPFTYKWNDAANSTKDSIANLVAGDYTVTITDTNGCSDVQTFKVDVVSATFEANSAISKLTLHPNPTSDKAILDVEFSKIMDARVQIINVMGQILSDQMRRQADKAQFELDLSGRPAGIYLVRIIADNKTHLTRLVKQ